MAIPTMTNDSPVAGSIAWGAFTIKYEGAEYAVSAGSTDQRWVWWRYNGGIAVIEGGPNLPSDLTDDDIVLFGNKLGIGVRVQSSTFVDGELLVDGSIFAAALAAECVVAGKIKAGVITTNELKSGAVTGAVIQTEETFERGVKINSTGFHAWDPDGKQTVSIGVDGKADFTGQVGASALTVAGQMKVSGQNEFSTESVTDLQMEVTASTLMPTVTVDHPSVTIGNFSSNPGCALGDGHVHLMSTYSSGDPYYYENRRLNRVNLATGATVSSIDIGPNDGGYHQKNTWGGIVKIGAYYWVLGQTANNIGWFLEQFDATTGVKQKGFRYSDAAPTKNPVIGTDGTNILVADASSGVILIKVFPTTTANGTTVVAPTSTYTSTIASPSGLCSLLYGAFDYGANRYIVANYGSATEIPEAFTFTLSGSTLTNLPNETFPLRITAGLVSSLVWDAPSAVFYVVGSGADDKIYKLAKTKWNTAPGTETWLASYAWGTSVGGYQTLQSPRKSFTMYKRARIVVTSVELAPTGTTPVVDQMWAFLGRGPADPGPTLMWHSTGTPVLNALTQAIDNETLTTGTHPNVGTPLPAGNAAKIQSFAKQADLVTPRWKLSGDGTLTHGKHGARLKLSHAGLTTAVVTALTPNATLEKGSPGYLRTAVGIQVPVTGLYYVTFTVVYSGAVWLGRSLADIIGTELGVTAQNRRFSTWSDTIISGSAVMPITAGGVLSINGYQASGTTRTCVGYIQVIGENLPDGW